MNSVSAELVEGCRSRTTACLKLIDDIFPSLIALNLCFEFGKNS
jgi:hypothetical protein